MGLPIGWYVSGPGKYEFDDSVLKSKIKSFTPQYMNKFKLKEDEYLSKKTDDMTLDRDDISVQSQDSSNSSINIGDQVQVRSDVSIPQFGWGRIGKNWIGTVTDKISSTVVRVDFPGRTGWKGAVKELKKIPKLSNKAPNNISIPKLHHMAREIGSDLGDNLEESIKTVVTNPTIDSELRQNFNDQQREDIKTNAEYFKKLTAETNKLCKKETNKLCSTMLYGSYPYITVNLASYIDPIVTLGKKTESLCK